MDHTPDSDKDKQTAQCPPQKKSVVSRNKVMPNHKQPSDKAGRAIERQTEESLRASEERLRLATEVAQMYSWEIDLITRAVKYSDNVARVIGFMPPNDFAAALTYIYAEDRPLMVEQFERAIRQREDFDFEYRTINPSGEILWRRSSGAAIPNVQGKVVRLVGVTQNITARKSLEQQMAGQNAALEAAALGKPLEEILHLTAQVIEQQLPNSLASVLLANDDGTQLFCGSARSLPAAYNAAIEGFHIGDNRGSCGTASYRRTPIIVADITTDPLWKDFRDLALAHNLRACWSHPILSPAGKLLGTFAIYFRQPRHPRPAELTLLASAARATGIAIERKFATEELLASEERLRLAQLSANIGVWDWKVKDNQLNWTTELEILYGLQPGSVQSYEDFRRCVHPADLTDMETKRDAAIRAHLPFDLEFRIIHPSGQVRWIAVKGGATYDENGEVIRILGNNIDITARKQAEEELRRSHDKLELRVLQRTHELEKANQALHMEIAERRAAEAQVTELLNRVVSVQENERHRIARELHDQLGQQLTALLIEMKAVQTREDCPPLIAQCLNQLKESITAIDKEVDRLSFELHPPILNDLGVAEALRQYAEEWSAVSQIPVDFQTTGLGDERLLVEMETAIYRIAQESLTNILKHAKAAQVSLIIERKRTQIILIIEDDGEGFDPETIKHAADAQYKVGLRGMRERLALLGGTLNIESARGQGTTLYVHIPLSSNKAVGQ